MILVDTTVWVDHLRNPEADLSNLLDANNVLMHPMVIGELDLEKWRNLPKISELSHYNRRNTARQYVSVKSMIGYKRE